MIRLTGGEWNGRPLKTLDSDKTRPTKSRLRQALMNSIQFDLEGARILDLFAGSGALGFEALSRGAEECVFVELSKSAVKLIEQNAKSLGCLPLDSKLSSFKKENEETAPKKTKILEGDWKTLGGAMLRFAPYDFIFCDPPYAEGMEISLLKELSFQDLLKDSGIFTLEWGRKKSVIDELPDEVNGLKKIREKVYGDSILSHFQKI